MDSPTLMRLVSPLSPTTRQTTRAMQELGGGGRAFSLRDLAMAVDNRETDSPLIQVIRPITTPLRETPAAAEPAERRLSLSNISSSHTPSPDEMVIQARGRRQVPLIFSPDLTPLRQQMQRTKLTGQAHASRLSLPANLRMSPRKRLILNDSPSNLSSPLFSPHPPMSPLAKKVKLDGEAVDPATAVKSLTHEQLVELVANLIKVHPEIREDVRSLTPPPDLAAMEERLNQFKRNIYKALPNTRLESKTDSLAYSRVNQHLLVFRREVLEDIKRLQDGEQWTALVDFTILAWGYVQATPVWDNPTHNNMRKSCFKSLAAACLTGLKRTLTAGLEPAQRAEVRQRLSRLLPAATEMEVCLKYLDQVEAEQKSLPT